MRCHGRTPVNGLKTIGSLQNGKEGERGGEKKIKGKMPLPSYHPPRFVYQPGQRGGPQENHDDRQNLHIMREQEFT